MLDVPDVAFVGLIGKRVSVEALGNDMAVLMGVIILIIAVMSCYLVYYCWPVGSDEQMVRNEERRLRQQKMEEEEVKEDPEMPKDRILESVPAVDTEVQHYDEILGLAKAEKEPIIATELPPVPVDVVPITDQDDLAFESPPEPEIVIAPIVRSVQPDLTPTPLPVAKPSRRCALIPVPSAPPVGGKLRVWPFVGSDDMFSEAGGKMASMISDSDLSQAKHLVNSRRQLNLGGKW
jgi:hypothetical protein